MKTVFPKKGDIKEHWYLVDAKGKVLGRLAAKIAAVLRGKNKPFFTPNADLGHSIIVINAKDLVLKGNKLLDKKYYHHTGYASGLKTETARKLSEEKPERLLLNAVSGMLPKSLLAEKLFKKLKVYPGPEHPHGAQNPTKLDIQ